MIKKRSVYRIQFYCKGQLYEMYANSVCQSGLYGFIEIEGLLFGNRSQMVVDPGEEKLKSEFAGVKRAQIPLHAIVRIDEVEKEGTGKISKLADGQGNVSIFPMPGLNSDKKIDN